MGLPRRIGGQRLVKWAVVLGASSGFGAAAARAMAREGWGIFGVHLDRRGAQPAIDALVAELRSHGAPVHFVNANAADDEVRTVAVLRLRELVGDGTVGLLLHSLAFGTLRPFVGEGALHRRQLEMTLDVMAHSLVWWAQDLFHSGLLGRGGRILAMTSAGSLAAWPSYGAVSGAKAALESYVRQLALELAPEGITANALMAGVTRTPALERIPGAETLAERALARNPHGRLTEPEDVASLIVSLTSPGTAWLTGNVLRVDGGESISG
jgi:NAD(P)-dependent dehydrogenase (short-subunit alcohol dehydrogenase family)